MDQRTISRLEWRRIFPWLWLFRTFRIALDFRKLLLGVVALYFVAGGNYAIDLLGMQSNATDRDVTRARTYDYPWDAASDLTPLSVSQLSVDADAFKAVFFHWDTLWQPMSVGAIEPVTTLVSGSEVSFARNVDAFLRLLWFLLVWGIFGGALTRMAIFEFVKDERLGMMTAVRYSVGKIIDFVSAPLVPIGGTICLLLLSALIGLFGRIPSVGPMIVSVLWFLPLIFSIGIVIMLIGVGAGWPLMIAAISTEDSDGFDGFSRAHSYVFDVPWQYLWSLVVLLCYASAALFFLDTAGLWVHHFAELGLGWGSGVRNESGDVWLVFVKTLLIGYRVSFFWCGFLMIYLVLRNVSDKKPLKDAFLEPLETGQPAAMALSGLSSIHAPIEERPVVNPDAETNESANPG
jgi:hypothetical protein